MKLILVFLMPLSLNIMANHEDELNVYLKFWIMAINIMVDKYEYEYKGKPNMTENLKEDMNILKNYLVSLDTKASNLKKKVNEKVWCGFKYNTNLKLSNLYEKLGWESLRMEHKNIAFQHGIKQT